MKICFLNKTLDKKQGEGHFGLEIIEATAKAGNQVVVFTEEKTGHHLEKAVLKPAYLLRNLFNIFVNALRLRKQIKDYDIIHSLEGYPYGIIASLVNIGLNKKLIINGIGTYSVMPLSKMIKKTLLKWAYKKADKLICISKFTQEQILKKVKLSNTIVINHGVNYNKFLKTNEEKQDKNSEEKIIISVGGLKPRKGYEIAIPSVAEVKKKQPDLKYYIVGGQPSKKYLSLVKQYDLEDNVKFFQNITDQELIDLYYQADLFLLPSVVVDNHDFEGFGLVYLEAGACGLPVVGTVNCGAEDAIQDKVTGLLVKQNDIQGTVEAILKILDNPELASKLGRAGKEKAKQNDWSIVVQKYLKVYQEILEK